MSQHQRHLLEIVNNVCCHPTAEEIHAIAREVSPRISLGTVYRNLNTLVESGKVRRISQPGKPDRFDKTVPHDHLICKGCGNVIDIGCIDCQCKSLPKGVKVQSFDVTAYGMCSTCCCDLVKSNEA